MLGNYPASDLNQSADLAYEFGKNFGMAFQLIDDLLDVTSTDADLGKPATADLKLGLSTAPVLFASQQVMAHRTDADDHRSNRSSFQNYRISF